MRGLGIPRGVTLIVGGGYHGKSTLLAALARGGVQSGDQQFLELDRDRALGRNGHGDPVQGDLGEDLVERGLVHLEGHVGPRRPGDPDRIVTSGAKAEAELGWQATRDLREMVASAWEAWNLAAAEGTARLG